MIGTGKQTALFFGFLAAAMTHASAQASPASSTPPQAGPTSAAIERLIADSGAAPRLSEAMRPAPIGSAHRGQKTAR